MKFGFIGCGNMGSAIAKAIAKKYDGESILLADHHPGRPEALAELLHASVCSNEEAALCDYVFLGVKPQAMPDMMSNIRPVLKNRKDSFILVTMAAGLSMAKIREFAGVSAPVIRIMPNTPTAIGHGMIEYCTLDVSDDQITFFLDAMEYAGELDPIKESLIDAASCVSGCAPAWAYQMLEALADGGVACGLPRLKALRYAAQMMLGSAQMVLETGEHPGKLKDDVCSPGGSTIQGVRVLEERGFRGAVTDAVIAAYEKTKALGK